MSKDKMLHLKYISQLQTELERDDIFFDNYILRRLSTESYLNIKFISLLILLNTLQHILQYSLQISIILNNI